MRKDLFYRLRWIIIFSQVNSVITSLPKNFILKKKLLKKNKKIKRKNRCF